MLHLDNELLDSTILLEFDYNSLWSLWNHVSMLRYDIENKKQYALNMLLVNDARDAEQKLFFLSRNINIIEEIMIIKEMDLVIFTEYAEYSLN